MADISTTEKDNVQVRHMRKKGGAVKGAKLMMRPDRRARGGATSDQNPESSAGRMSESSYERVGAKPNGGGKGPDRD